MYHFPILTILVFLPAIAVIFISFFVDNKDTENKNLSFWMAIWTCLITFILSLVVLFNFDFTNPDFQFVESYDWISEYGFGFKLGIDGISLFMVMLTTIISPIALIAAKDSIKVRQKEFMILFLLLESFVLGTFLALDLLIFYIFFEIMLVPMFLLIGIWGGEERTYAAFKFFLYTLAGSIIFLIAIIYIYFKTESFDIVYLQQNLSYFLGLEEQKYLWLAFFVAFAVKIPMWPFHTWLPDAHVQAPTSGSIILAAVLIKMGAYGFLRFSLPFFPVATLQFQDFMIVLSLVALTYTSIVAMMQVDMKKLIAYSSVAHMGYVTLGIFSLNNAGINGALFQMISHGIISAGLFFSVGIIYDRYKTKKISKLTGIADLMPRFAIFFMIMVFGSVALPGTSGFIGEFLAIMAVYEISVIYAFIAASSVILGAVYMLYLSKNTIMGPSEKNANIIDLNRIEVLVFLLLAIFVILLGIYPSLIFDYTNSAVDKLINNNFALNF